LDSFLDDVTLLVEGEHLDLPQLEGFLARRRTEFLTGDGSSSVPQATTIRPSQPDGIEDLVALRDTSDA
jgi:hypothetical protein